MTVGRRAPSFPKLSFIDLVPGGKARDMWRLLDEAWTEFGVVVRAGGGPALAVSLDLTEGNVAIEFDIGDAGAELRRRIGESLEIVLDRSLKIAQRARTGTAACLVMIRSEAGESESSGARANL